MILGATDTTTPVVVVTPPAPAPEAKQFPFASMILPTFVMALVDRKKHPFLWWVFGPISVASSVAIYQAKKK